MNIKKVSKILAVVLIVMMIVAFSTSVFALEPTDVSGEGGDTTGLESFGYRILNILSVAGIILSVIVLVVIGIKYMLGSAEEKAEYKKTLLPYLIGAILIFGASTIAQFVYNFMQ